jgi:hypothetical protein
MTTKGYPSSWDSFQKKHPRFNEGSMVDITSVRASDWGKQQLIALAVHLNLSHSAAPLLEPYLPVAKQRVHGNPQLMAALQMFEGSALLGDLGQNAFQQCQSFGHFYTSLASVIERRPPPPPSDRPERQRTQTKFANFSSSSQLDLTPSTTRTGSEHSAYTSGSDGASSEEAHQDRRTTRETASRKLGLAFVSAMANWAGPRHNTAYLCFTIEESTFDVNLGGRVQYSAVNDGSLLVKRRIPDTKRWWTVRLPVYGSVESKRAVMYWHHDDDDGVATPILSLGLLGQIVASMIGLVEQHVIAHAGKIDELSGFERT